MIPSYDNEEEKENREDRSETKHGWRNRSVHFMMKEFCPNCIFIFLHATKDPPVRIAGPIMSKKRFLSWIIVAITLVVDFLYYVARSAFASTAAIGLDGFHTFLLLVFSISFTSGLIESDDRNPLNPVRLLGRSLITLVSLLILLSVIQMFDLPAFQTRDQLLMPGGFTNVLASYVAGVLGLCSALILGVSLTRLVFVKRRKHTKRYYLVLVGLVGGQMALQYITGMTGTGEINVIKILDIALSILIIGFSLINAFRFSWVVMLSRQEKWMALALSVFSLVFAITLAVLSGDGNGYYHSASRYFSVPGQVLNGSVFIFAAVYMLVATMSVLIHIPTAREFDQRKNEVSSLHTMSQLINEVLDYRELLGTTAQLALDVAEAQASWIVLHPQHPGRFDDGDLVPLSPHTLLLVPSLNRISDQSVRDLYTTALERLHREDAMKGDLRLVQSLSQDLHLSSGERRLLPYHSFAFLPLRDHSGSLGTLCLAKREEYGFDQEVLPALASFSDLVTIAIENSRLIEESFEKERMERELDVARHMQQKLLPQHLPTLPCVSISASSLPAYEVGGDYYDVLEFEPGRIGMVIADVSGKGVSAALYMAQVKGIFQSLARHEPDPHALLTSMNDILCRNLERQYFVSLLYGILDCASAQFRYARAGHPPLIYMHEGVARELRPSGMALGLEAGSRFAESLEVHTLTLSPGDSVILYTDGISEAHDPSGAEFGPEGIIHAITGFTPSGAKELAERIATRVRSHATMIEDDSTMVVFHWLGSVRLSS